MLSALHLTGGSGATTSGVVGAGASTLQVESELESEEDDPEDDDPEEDDPEEDESDEELEEDELLSDELDEEDDETTP